MNPEPQIKSSSDRMATVSSCIPSRTQPGPHERSDETGKVTIYFDMNMGDGNNPNGQNWTSVEGDGPHALGNHERVSFRITTQLAWTWHLFAVAIEK